MNTFEDQLIAALRAFQDECVRLAQRIADDAEQQLQRLVAANVSSSIEEAQDSMARMQVATSRNVAAHTLIDTIGTIDVAALVRRSTQPPTSPAPPLHDNEDD